MNARPKATTAAPSREEKSMDEPTRTYTLSSTACPREVWEHNRTGITDELILVISEPDIKAEFFIEWIALAGDPNPTPRLCAFDDGWKGVEVVLPILVKFAEQSLSPETLIGELEAIGFVPSEFHGHMTVEGVG